MSHGWFFLGSLRFPPRRHCRRFPEPVDTDKEAREARIKALIRRRRGRAGLVATGDRGVLQAPAGASLLATRLGE